MIDYAEIFKILEEAKTKALIVPEVLDDFNINKGIYRLAGAFLDVYKREYDKKLNEMSKSYTKEESQSELVNLLDRLKEERYKND